MDDESIESASVEILDDNDKSSFDIQIATAKKYPRDIVKCISEATIIACMDEATARSCRYALPRAGKAITGASVVAAKIAAQSWGNMRINSNIKQITNTHVISEAIAFDLEKNMAVKVEVRKSISGKYGRYSNDMITTTSMAASSVALRNAIFAVIPKNVISSILNATKNIITRELDSQDKIDLKAKSIFDYYKKTYDTTEQEYLKLINRGSFKEITKDDIVVLYDFFESLRAGDSNANDIFGRRKSNLSDKKNNMRTNTNKNEMP